MSKRRRGAGVQRAQIGKFPRRAQFRRARGRGAFLVGAPAARARRALLPELKFYDTSLANRALTKPTDASGGECDQSATVGPTTIAQGDGESNRDGRKCTVTSCFITGVIEVAKQADQTDGDIGGTVFIALVQDRQTNGALLNSEDVFSNPGALDHLATSPLRNMQYTNRFKVLARKLIQLPQAEMTYDGTNIEQGGFHVPFMLSWRGVMPMQFTGTTSDISNSQTNSLHVIAYCSDTTQVPQMSYNCRVRFQG